MPVCLLLLACESFMLRTYVRTSEVTYICRLVCDSGCDVFLLMSYEPSKMSCSRLPISVARDQGRILPYTYTVVTIHDGGHVICRLYLNLFLDSYYRCFFCMFDSTCRHNLYRYMCTFFHKYVLKVYLPFYSRI